MSKEETITTNVLVCQKAVYALGVSSVITK